MRDVSCPINDHGVVWFFEGPRILVPDRDGLLEHYDGGCTLTWSYTMSGVGTIADVVQMSDGYVLSGSLYGKDRLRAGLARISDEGEELWRAAYSWHDGYHTQPRFIARHADGFTLVGYGGGTSFAVRFDEDGQFIWERAIAGEGTTPVAVAALPDGGIAVAFQVDAGSHSFIDRIARYAASGAPIWSRAFGPGDIESRVDAMHVLDDGRLMVVGTLGDAGITWSVHQMLIEYVDLR